MTTTETIIDNFPTSALQDRYQIGKQAVQNRIKHLNIQPVERGRVSPEQLRLLDELHKHIVAGGKMAEFKSQSNYTSPSTKQKPKQGALSHETEQPPPYLLITQDILSKLAIVAQHISESREATQPSLNNYKELELAAEKQWPIPTSLVKSLTKTTPSGNKHTWGCFEFTKAGKLGKENGWLVQRLH